MRAHGWSIAISYFMPIIIFITVVASVGLRALAAYARRHQPAHVRGVTSGTGSPALSVSPYAEPRQRQQGFITIEAEQL